MAQFKIDIVTLARANVGALVTFIFFCNIPALLLKLAEALLPVVFLGMG